MMLIVFSSLLCLLSSSYASTPWWRSQTTVDPILGEINEVRAGTGGASGSIGMDSEGNTRAGLEYENDNVRARFSDGHGGPRFDMDVHHRWDNHDVRGTGYTDSHGNWGGSLKWSWGGRKRRSSDNRLERFHLFIQASECQFGVYDANDDGLITKAEMHEVFADEILAEKLFRNLDMTTGDDAVTIREFHVMAPRIIAGCSRQNQGVPDVNDRELKHEKQEPETEAK